VFGIAGVNSTPLVLVTNKADAKDLTDLGPNDKLAMPAMVSPQMYALQMIAEKRYGVGQQDHFRTMVTALPHPDSVNALLSGGTEVHAYFSTPPFTQIVLDSGKAHVLTTSEEAFGGRSTFLALGGCGLSEGGAVKISRSGARRCDAEIGARRFRCRCQRCEGRGRFHGPHGRAETHSR
jgi:hypothetical protein